MDSLCDRRGTLLPRLGYRLGVEPHSVRFCPRPRTKLASLASSGWTVQRHSRSVSHVPTHYGLTKPWTVDDPPSIVTEFVHWYTWERAAGETAIDFIASSMGSRLSMANAKVLMRDERVLTLLDRALRTSNAGPLRVQAVMDMLYMRATVREDVKAAQLYLQAVDRLTQRTTVDVTITDARRLSDEQLHAELARATKMLEARRQAEPPIVDAEVVSDEVA